jgi:4-amino-4-deoxychorismate lyase
MNNIFFETIKIVDSEILNLEYHQKRYENVLKIFDIDDAKDLKTYINPPKKGTYRCKVIYDISNLDSIEVLYYEYTKRKISSLKIIRDDDIEYKNKSIDREKIDTLFSKRDGCDDILIVKNKLVTDTSIANIAFYDGESWLTPRQPLLKGTTRDRYLSNKKLKEVDIDVEELDRFSKIALLNAMIDFDIIADINYK